MKLPLNNPRITSPYGVKRADGKIHNGIDIISTSGDRIVKAICDGTVRGTFIDEMGFGYYVSVQHEDGKRALYCHLAEFRCRAGDKIKAGDVIGIEGETGNSTGIHLHLEIRESDYTPSKHINVADYLGIKNEKGDVVEVKKEFADGEELEALDYLVEQGRILDKEYALKKLSVVNNEKWYIIKWANDVKMLQQY